MEAKAKAPHSVIRAFTGREFVKYEWRPVPPGHDDEARRLELDGWLVIQDDEPEPEPELESGLESWTVTQLRDELRLMGLSYSGLKKAELIAALEGYEEEE